MRSIHTNTNSRKKNLKTKRHPFAVPFSPRRMAQPGFDRRTPPTGPRTLGEILNAPRPKLRHHQRWGDWRLDAHRLTLDYAPDDVWRYELDLEADHDAASILDFILQVNGKVWADAQVMADLLDALHDILDPQGNLCSGRVNRSIDHEKFFAERIEPPTDTEREKSCREAFEGNAAWLGSEMANRLARR